MADFTATALEKLGVRNVISSDICLNIPSFLRGATEQQTTHCTAPWTGCDNQSWKKSEKNGQKSCEIQENEKQGVSLENGVAKSDHIAFTLRFSLSLPH